MATSLAQAGEVLKAMYREADVLGTIREQLRVLESFKPPQVFTSPWINSGVRYELRQPDGRRTWIVPDPDAWLYLLAGLEVLEGAPEFDLPPLPRPEDWKWRE